ncbi:MAG: hypothetical protein IPF50_12935 [Proteobacteria bacterium]|nr:hypothetical protein [Pseudomonadota bacterium]
MRRNRASSAGHAARKEFLSDPLNLETQRITVLAAGVAATHSISIEF